MKKKVIVLTDGLIPNIIQNWLDDTEPERQPRCFMYEKFAEARSNPELIKFIENNAVRATKKQETEFIASGYLKQIEKKPNEITTLSDTHRIDSEEGYEYCVYYSQSNEVITGHKAEFHIIELDTSVKWILKEEIDDCETIVRYKEPELINQELNLYRDTNN